MQLSKVMVRSSMNPIVSDQAICLDLIAKSRGIAVAKRYVLDLLETSKTYFRYDTLLNSYCKVLMIEKAESLMEKMKELNFLSYFIRERWSTGGTKYLEYVLTRIHSWDYKKRES
jgi:pentatricopeptide repeat protein